MPTGYTAKLMEKGESFQEFVMRCARAMGACVTMRDDDMNAPIPEKFEPSDYHVKALESAKERLCELQRMPHADRRLFAEKQKNDRLRSLKSSMSNMVEEDARLLAMEKKVKAWTPPTADHDGLKEFMLQQLEISKNNADYWNKDVEAASSESLDQYYNQAVVAAKRDIEYHTEEYAKEVERCESRTRWLQQLRKSLIANK